MSMIDISFFPPLPILANGFFQLANDVTVRSLREPLQKSIKDVVAPAFHSHFEEGGDSDGAWEEWDEDTVKHNQSRSLLVKSGRLKKRGGSQALWVIDGAKGEARAENLSGVEYGAVHQRGAPSVNLPARPWATLSERDMEKIQSVFGVWIEIRIQRRIMAL
jgi:phage gpG-like protein